MKNRWISLLLVLALVVSLMPMISMETDALWVEYDERYEVDGSYYTTSSKMAQKLNQIFDGNANIYHDRACTNAVNVRIGTSNVKNNGITMYAGPYGGPHVNSGTSCWIYAAGVYYTLFGNIGLTNPTSKSERLDLNKGSGTITSYNNFKAWGVRDGVGAHIRTSSHSMIVLDYDKDTITILDGNNDGNGKVSVRKRSWDKFNYYVSYIVQPTDAYYYSEYPVYDCEHDYTAAVTKAAGCVEDGVITFSCTKCPDSYTQSIPATGHNFQNDYCIVCGGYDSSILKGTCGSELNWTLRSGKLTVEGSGSMYDYGYSGAPWFKNRTSIKEVVIDEGITNIGDHAFAFSENLTSVTIGDNVKTIGDFAFQSCPRIANLDLGNGVQSIGLEAFKYTAIKKLEIPDSTTYIGDLAFGFCEMLADVQIGKNVATVGGYAFYNDPSLKNIHFAGRAPTIGEDAFGEVKATVHYPTNDPSWDAVKGQHYGGNLTWESYYQGINLVDGEWGYYYRGVLDIGFIGLAPYEGELFYVENGKINWNYMGIVTYGDVLYYVVNSRVDKTYQGIVEHDGEKLYVVDGCVDQDYTGLAPGADQWYYVENGRWVSDHIGLVAYGDNLFYVENGILDFTYTGLVWYNDAWTYVANSQLTEGYTGLVWFNDNWFYVVDSIIDWTFTGLVPYEGNYFYVQNNLLDWSYTGLGYHDGGWYFIQNGLLQKEYSGLVYFNDNWFYVEEGVLTYQFFGMVEYQGNMFYVQASHLDWNYTGLGYHEGVWYYFLNALYMPEYDGLGELDGNVFYVEDGTVNWDFTGEVEIDGVTYTVKEGLVINN